MSKKQQPTAIEAIGDILGGLFKAAGNKKNKATSGGSFGGIPAKPKSSCCKKGGGK